MTRDVVDVDGTPDAPTLRQLGLGFAPYTGAARPSDDWLAENGDLVDWFVQETYSTRSSEIPSQGGPDCVYAEAVARAHPMAGQRIAVVVSDGNSGDTWDASQYGLDWANAATIPFFPYGDDPICASFIAGALRGAGAPLLVLGDDGRPGDWLPSTWGYGTIATQVVGPSPVPGTDLNHVHISFGAVPPTNVQEDDDMLYLNCISGPATKDCQTGYVYCVGPYRVDGIQITPAAPLPAGVANLAIQSTTDECQAAVDGAAKALAALGAGGGGGAGTAGPPGPPGPAADATAIIEAVVAKLTAP